MRPSPVEHDGVADLDPKKLHVRNVAECDEQAQDDPVEHRLSAAGRACGGLGSAACRVVVVAHLGVFVDDVAIRFGVTVDVIHIPSEGSKKRIDEILPKLRLLIGGGRIILMLLMKAIDEVSDRLRNWSRCH